MTPALPARALSVRQPWAWAIAHAGKDVENRSVGALKHMTFAAGERIAIHAAKGMTRDEYEEAAEFMASLGVACPAAADLLRGGIVGSVRFDRVVKKSESPWFFGPRAIALSDAAPCDFLPCMGNLGLFGWKSNVFGAPAPPLRWMLAPPALDLTIPEGKV